MAEIRPIIFGPDEGEFLRTQVERRVVATPETTGGRLSLTVATAEKGFGGPPLHLHLRDDEAFFVLEGELRFRAGEEERTVGPGGFVYVPANTPHAFTSVGDGHAKLIEMFIPGDFDGYFRELAGLIASKTWTRETVDGLQEKYGMVVLGPGLGLALGDANA
jgi:mannose-6-phosphate isomerase-like protein (cupin superfamily)